MLQALMFWWYDNLDIDVDEISRDFYARAWKSALAAIFWALLFVLLHVNAANKKDPYRNTKEETEEPEDVQAEKDLVNRVAETIDTPQDEETGSPSQKPKILAQNLTKIFTKHSGPFVAVDGISFQVKQGECFGLLGKNGAGKSTTMNMLTTVLEPSEGSSWLGGVSDTWQKQQIIGYCPQKDLLWNKLSVSAPHVLWSSQRCEACGYQRRSHQAMRGFDFG